jgi:hypothetical protein
MKASRCEVRRSTLAITALLMAGSGDVARAGVIVDVRSLDCVETPDLKAKSIATVSRGERYEMLDQEGSWAKINHAPACWVSVGALSDEPKVTNEPVSASTRREAEQINRARESGSAAPARSIFSLGRFAGPRCKTGIPCGMSCISAAKVCHK